MPSAADHLRAAIQAAGGQISFAEFMSHALYGDEGFYTRDSDTGRAGRRGDFITSPEVGPLFGAVIARALDNWWNQLGRPEVFTFVDVGAGPATLARSVLSSEFECKPHLRYIAVEISAAQRAMHPTGVESVAVMPTALTNAVVFANELLDNLAFELWVYDGGWKQSYVTTDGDKFVEVLVVQEPPACLPTSAPHGSRAPVLIDACNWLQHTLAHLDNGVVVVIDYCSPSTTLIAHTPWREWLRTYVGHERGGHYLQNPGKQDITVQVLIDQLQAIAVPTTVRTQEQFLQLWGIDDLVVQGKRVWQENASAPNLAAMKMRSRVSEAEALLDAAGLGAFTVLEWQKQNLSARDDSSALHHKSQ